MELFQEESDASSDSRYQVVMPTPPPCIKQA